MSTWNGQNSLYMFLYEFQTIAAAAASTIHRCILWCCFKPLKCVWISALCGATSQTFADKQTKKQKRTSDKRCRKHNEVLVSLATNQSLTCTTDDALIRVSIMCACAWMDGIVRSFELRKIPRRCMLGYLNLTPQFTNLFLMATHLVKWSAT